MRLSFMIALLAAACAPEPPSKPLPPHGDPRWQPAPVSRLSDSSVRIEHVRGRAYRVWNTAPGAGGGFARGGGRTGTFGDLMPVRR